MADVVPSTVMAKVREAGRHSVIYGLGSIAQAAASFILIPILTAALSTDDFGVYSLLQMASAVASAIFYLGMTSALPRSYFDYADEEDRKSVFTTAFVILLTGAFLQVVVGFVAGGMISRALFHSDAYVRVIFIAFLGGALSFVNQFFFAYLRFLRKSITSVVLSIVTFCGSTGLTIAFVMHDPHDLDGIFLAVVIVQAVIAGAMVIQYGRKTFSRHLNKREVSILLKFGIPTILTSFAVMLIEWSDRVIIERLLSIGDVGIYSVGYKIGSLINVLIIAPFVQIWSVMMVEYRKHDDIKAFFKKILSYYFLIGSLVIVVSALFIKEAAPIVIRSGHHAEAIPTIILIMVGYLIYGSVNILSAGLIYERKIFVFTIVYYIFAFLKIGMNLLVIPALGITGAALTTVVIWGMIPIALYLCAKRYFSFSADMGRLLRIVAITAVPVVYVLAIEPHHSLPIAVKASFLFLFMICFYFFCTDVNEKKTIARVCQRLFMHRSNKEHQ